MKNKFNKITIIALTILIALSSVTLGKVFAYFGAKSSASGAIEMGHLYISDAQTTDNESINWNINNLQPNQSFGGSYKVDVTSNINYYIRILFHAQVTPQSSSTHINGTACEDYVTDDTDILSISIDGTTANTYQKSDTKTLSGYTAYYKLSPTQVTSATTTEVFNIDLKINDWVGCNYCHYYMNASVSIDMQVEVLQADYLESSSKGGTVASVSSMHAIWSSIMDPVYSVTITNNLNNSTDALMDDILEHYGYSSTVYYAVDGETNWHALNEGESTTLVVADAVLFSIDNTVAVDWNSITTTADTNGQSNSIWIKMGTEIRDIFYASTTRNTVYIDGYGSSSANLGGFVITENSTISIEWY